jgi:hypothetical protein
MSKYFGLAKRHLAGAQVSQFATGEIRNTNGILPLQRGRATSWSAVSVGGSTAYKQVIYNDSVYFMWYESNAVGATSSDGSSWTVRTMSQSGYWYPGFAIKGGAMGVIAYSDTKTSYSSNDGVSWTSGTMPASRAWYIAINTPSYSCIYTRADTNMAYSTDGTSWTQYTLPSNQDYRCAGISGGWHFILPFQVNTGYKSRNGYSTWTSISLPTGNKNWSAIAGDGKRVIAIDGTTTAWYSDDDGGSWTSMTMPSAPGHIYFNGRVWVAATLNDIMVSTNGTTWTSFNPSSQLGYSSNTLQGYNYMGLRHPVDLLTSTNTSGYVLRSII